MARIVQLLPGHQDVKPHTSEVDCYAQVLATKDGVVLAHISTFGSSDRKSAPKSSQSMQFDERSARALVEFFVKSFGKQVLPAD